MIKNHDCPEVAFYLHTHAFISDNVVQQLEKYLGRVKEITGALKISHSYPIVSLDFFSSLEMIRGESVNVLLL